MGHLFKIESPLFHILTRIIDIFLINVLFLLFCIPIFTIGAATTALYSVSMKMTRHEEKQILKDFFIAFKRSFVQSTVIWMVLAATGVVILGNIFLLGHLSGLMKFFFAGMILIFTMLYGSIVLFIFPYVARFKDSLKVALKNALLIGMQNMLQLVVLLFINGFIILFILSSNVGLITGLYFGTFGGFACLAYINSHFIVRVFKKYEIQI